MKFAYLITFAALAALAGTAKASDLPAKSPPPAPPAVSTSGFDYAFGAKIQSDYISRGITQTNHQPGVTAYFEGRYNFADTQLYAGVQPWSVKLPTNPAAEVDLYGGLRQTWGSLTVDAGAIYYAYPNNTRQFFTDGVVTALAPFAGGIPTTAKNPSYYEVYLKPSYAINDMFTVGANGYYSSNWNNYKADEYYVSATAKVNLPANFSVSGELGYQHLGTSSATYGPTKFRSYTTWNVGVSYAYKVATLDVRYYGTNLSKGSCYINGSDPKGNVVGGIASLRSNWCDQRIMASLSFDITSKDLK